MTKNDNFWSFLQFCYFCRFCHFWHFITFCLFPNFVTFVFSLYLKIKRGNILWYIKLNESRKISLYQKLWRDQYIYIQNHSYINVICVRKGDDVVFWRIFFQLTNDLWHFFFETQYFFASSLSPGERKS